MDPVIIPLAVAAIFATVMGIRKYMADRRADVEIEECRDLQRRADFFIDALERKK
jgi:hypothetical protein